MNAATTASDLKGQLARQAADSLQALLRQIDAQFRQTDAVRERLATSLTAAKDAHTYAVFPIVPTRRFMVLRDVEECEGEKPVHTTSDFAAAILWVNSQLDAARTGTSDQDNNNHVTVPTSRP